MGLIPDVELITVDKGAGFGGIQPTAHRHAPARRVRPPAAPAAVAARERHRRLHPGRVKLGFDKPRARELQWLFTNARIAPREREHVLDSFLGFADALGVPRQTLALGHPAAARCARLRRAPDPRFAPDPGHQRLLQPSRTQLAAPAIRRRGRIRRGKTRHARDPVRRAERAWNARWRRPSRVMRARRSSTRWARTHCRSCSRCCRARRRCVTPDSGPAHMATMVGLPVIGLYAATNPAAQRPLSFAALVRGCL